MSEEKSKQTILQDSENIKHVIVVMDMQNNSTRIMSGLTLWGNIRVFASGIGVSYRKLLAEGENPITAYKMLEKVIIEMLDTDYDIQNAETEETGIGTGDSGKTESVGVKSDETKGAIDNKQPISENDHKPEEKDKKPVKSKNKNKKGN